MVRQLNPYFIFLRSIPSVHAFHSNIIHMIPRIRTYYFFHPYMSFIVTPLTITSLPAFHPSLPRIQFLASYTSIPIASLPEVGKMTTFDL
jgi:hypothetical protein